MCDALVAVISEEEDVENDANDEDAAEKLVVVIACEVLPESAVCEEGQKLRIVVECHALVSVWRCLLLLTRWCTLWPLLSIFLFSKMMFGLLIVLLIHLLIPILQKLVMLLAIVLRKATSLPFFKVLSFFLVPSIHILSLLPFSTFFGFPVLA